MIPTPQIGKMKKLNQTTFRGEGWELVTDTQVIQSMLEALGIDNDDYRCAYVLTGLDDTTICGQGFSALLEVWAGWHEEPHKGSIFVCLYDRGKTYVEQNQE